MSPRRPPSPAGQPSPGEPAKPNRPAAGRPAGKVTRPAARPAGARRPPAPSRPSVSSRPSATRPAARSRLTAGRPAARGGTNAGTGRPIWVLGGVAVVLAVLILPYFQKWLVQRSQIQATQVQVSQSQQEVQRLSEQLRRWEDDDYVKAQARERLHYVMPGEEGYVVIDPKAKKPVDPGERAADVPVGDKPWYSEVWVSAQVAGAAGS